jgi:anti-sigma regulatory factor (Ser/Thr protein kinase)
MAVLPNVRLNLANRPENVPIVLDVLAGVADLLGLDALARDGLNTVGAELCKNVVLHAYDGAEGPLEVELYLTPQAIELLVRDHGIGIRPHLGERSQPHTGIGMPIVHLLSRRVTYTNLPNGGTEVLVELPLDQEAPFVPLQGPEPATPFTQDVERRETIECSAGPAAVIEAVLPGVLAALPGASPERAERFRRLARALAERSDPTGAQPLWLLLDRAADTAGLRLGPVEDPAVLTDPDATRKPLFRRVEDAQLPDGWPPGTIALRLLAGD